MKIYLVTVCRGGRNEMANWNVNGATATVFTSVSRIEFKDGNFIYPSRNQIYSNFVNLGEFPQIGDLILFKIAPLFKNDDVKVKTPVYNYYKNSPINGFVAITKPINSEYKNKLWLGNNTSNLIKGNVYEGTAYSFYNRKKGRITIKSFFDKKMDCLVLGVDSFLQEMLSSKSVKPDSSKFLNGLLKLIEKKRIVNIPTSKNIFSLFNGGMKSFNIQERELQVNPKLKNLSEIALWKLFINKLYFYERFTIEDELKRIFSGKNQQLIYIIKQIIENPTIELNLKDYPELLDLLQFFLKRVIYTSTNKRDVELYSSKTK